MLFRSRKACGGIAEIRNEIVKTCKGVYKKGLINAAGGNISAFDPHSEKVIITPTGISLRNITAEKLTILDMKGNRIKGKLKASKEGSMHIGIYQEREDIRSLVHVHPPVTVGLSLVKNSLPMVTGQSIANLKKVPFIEYASAGTQRLAHLVRGAFKDLEVKCCVMKRHGLMASGKTLKEAWDIAELVEETAINYVTALQIESNKNIPRIEYLP